MVDTHALLWHLNDDAQLPKTLSELIHSKSNTTFVSVDSLWEISIKQSIGKLVLRKSLAIIYRKLNLSNVVIIHIEQTHLERLQTLPHHHRDPFDRLLIAQALSENLTVITKDKHFPAYGVETLW